MAGSFGPRKNRELGARTQQGPVRSRGAGPLPSCYALGGLGERIGVGHQVSWVLPATGGYPAGPAKRRFITPSILPALFLKSNGPTQATDFQCQGGRNAHHDVNRQQLDQDGPRAGFSNQSRTPHGSDAMTAFVNRARSRHGTNYLTRHCWIQPSSRPPMTPEGSGMALYLEHAISHPAAIDPVPSVEAEVHAAGHLVGRWSSVPSRELRRIRQILLRGGRHMGATSTIDLPESARELLEHVTAELQRRGQFGSQSWPAQCRPGSAHTLEWRKGALCHGRSM